MKLIARSYFILFYEKSEFFKTFHLNNI